MPRLILPSNGGGTKLMRTLRSGIAVGLGDGDNSCAGKGWPSSTPSARASKTFFVISSEVETSLTFFFLRISRDSSNFARNDKLEKTRPVGIWEQVILCFALREKIAIEAPMGVILSRADGEGSLIVVRRDLRLGDPSSS